MLPHLVCLPEPARLPACLPPYRLPAHIPVPLAGVAGADASGAVAVLTQQQQLLALDPPAAPTPPPPPAAAEEVPGTAPPGPPPPPSASSEGRVWRQVAVLPACSAVYDGTGDLWYRWASVHCTAAASDTHASFIRALNPLISFTYCCPSMP